MEIKYFTPEIQANRWNFNIPQSQRTPESKEPGQWVYLPEGVHTVQIIWQGIKEMFLRTRGVSEGGSGTLIFEAGANNTAPRITQVVVPPGGLELLFGTTSMVTTGNITATSTVWAGVTIYIGTNETL